MTQFLPPNLLALFAPRDAIQFKPPTQQLTWEKDRLRSPYTGIGHLVNLFEDPKDTPPQTRGEKKAEKKHRRIREKAEQRSEAIVEEVKAWDPHNDPNATSDAFKTMFVGRINYDTTESKLRREFEMFGKIRKVHMVTNTATGKPRGYAFIEYEKERDMHSAYKSADGKKIDGRRVLVDVERGRTVKGWRPRRLGGGLGSTRAAGEDERPRPTGDEMEKERRDGGRTERSRDSIRERRHRSRDRERGGDRDRGDRDRDRERGGDRDRPRDRERGETDRGDRDKRKDRERRDRSDRSDRDRDRDRRDRDKKRDGERKERRKDEGEAESGKKEERSRESRHRHRDRSRERDGSRRDRDKHRDRGDRGDKERSSREQKQEISVKSDEQGDGGPGLVPDYNLQDGDINQEMYDQKRNNLKNETSYYRGPDDDQSNEQADNNGYYNNDKIVKDEMMEQEPSGKLDSKGSFSAGPVEEQY